MNPLPRKPVLQRQVTDPSTLVQVAFGSQGFEEAHSFISSGVQANQFNGSLSKCEQLG